MLPRMAMRLDHIVPFGRTLDEYRAMFALTDEELRWRILGVGDGPASFNAELQALEGDVLSIDPIYRFTGNEIRARFDAVVDDIMAQVAASPDDWVWGYHRSPEALRDARRQAIERFCLDYDRGCAEGHYRAEELPRLPFDDDTFDLALCSHLLFLYSRHLDAGFHRRSLFEMLRVAREVRVFPLLTLMREPSPHLPHLLQDLQAAGYRAHTQSVPYELQRGGNQMLRVQRGPQAPSPRMAVDLEDESAARLDGH